MKAGVVALVFRATPDGRNPGPTDEAAAVAWWTADRVRDHMVPAFAVRVTDALTGIGVAVRQHDGVELLAG